MATTTTAGNEKPLTKRRSSSKMVKDDYNPWDKAQVWAMLDPPEGLWQEAIVIDHVPADEKGKDWTFTVEIEPGSKHIVKTASIDSHDLEFQSIKRRDKVNTVDVTDMVTLTFLNEAEMIECMRLRFKAKQIYTNTGPILMAINPFERLPVYTREVLDKYYNAQADNKLGPHVYQMSDRAYKKMFVDRFDPDKRENQTILVNGESGAGKTESTKQVLKYLSVVSSSVASKLGIGGDGADVENQIVASNPITESFGNAKTSRNNNSSRFGKFIELGYSADGFIEGATVRTYLLETVRIARQMTGERNYHIFYEIFAGLPKKQKDEWGITALQDFNYTNQSGEYNRHDDETDIDNYERLRDAMLTLNFPTNMQDEVIKIVLAVLHIGNITFTESSVAGEEAANFSEKSAKHISQVCSLIGVSSETLLVAMARRSFTVAGSEIQKALNSEGAIFARDTFAKVIYDGLFKWMISQVNIALSANMSGEPASFIGVLDIFGFEFFAKNSFEQLCINYTNEKLQDHFNYSIFKSEQEVYKEEGLNWTFVDYPDNSARLELLEHKVTGIFALCDEQLKVPKCSDEKFAKSLYDKCGKHKFFAASKSEQVKYEFVIKHFACDVKYQAAGFLDKNRSDIAKEYQECMSKSTNVLFRILGIDESTAHANKSRLDTVPKAAAGGPTSSRFSDASRSAPAAGRAGASGTTIGKKSSSTVSAQFSKQLVELVTKIRTTRSHFIRCIKPNAELKPAIFDQNMVLKQLRCGGALGAIQVFRAGFSNRMDFMGFVTKFGCLSYPPGMNPMTRDLFYFILDARRTGSDKTWKQAASKLIDIVPLSESVLNIIQSDQLLPSVNVKAGLQLGKTQVFLRAEVFEHMERLLFRTVNLVAMRMQHRFRAWKLAKSSKGMKGVHGIATETFDHFTEHRREQTRYIVCATLKIQRRARVYLTVKYRKTIVWLVTQLAALYRGWKGRLKAKKRRAMFATRITALVRRFLCRCRYLRFLKERKEKGAAAVLETAAPPPVVHKQAVAAVTPIKPKPVEKKAVHQPPPPPIPDETLKNIEKMKAQIAQLEIETKEKELLQAKMKSNEEEKQKQLETFQRNITLLEEEKNKETLSLQQTIKSMNDENETIKQQHQQQLQSFQDFNKKQSQIFHLQIRNLEEEKNKNHQEYQSKLTEKENEVAQYQKQLQELKASDIILQSKVNQLEAEKEALRKDNTTTATEVTNLRNEILTKEEECNNLKTELLRSKSEVASIRNSLSTLESERSTTQANILQTKVEVSTLRAQVMVLDEERVTAKAEATAARAEVISIKGIMSLLEAEKKAAKEDVDSYVRKMASLQSLITTAENENIRINAEIIHLKSEIAGLRQQTSLLEEERLKLKSDIVTLKSDAAGLTTRLALMEDERNAARLEVISAKADANAARAGVDGAIEAASTLHIKEVMKLKNDISNLEEERNIARVELAKANDQVIWLQGQVASVVESQKIKAASESEYVTKENTLLLSKIAALEAQLTQSEAEIALAKAEAESKKYIPTEEEIEELNTSSIRDKATIKDLNDQINYLKGQVLLLEEQKEQSGKLVAYLRNKMQAIKTGNKNKLVRSTASSNVDDNGDTASQGSIESFRENKGTKKVLTPWK